jgi:hypothetical protein
MWPYVVDTVKTTTELSQEQSSTNDKTIFERTEETVGELVKVYPPCMQLWV